MPKVRATVNLMTENYRVITLLPGDEIPEWALDKITNPAVLDFSDTEEEATAETSENTGTEEAAVDYSTLSKDELVATCTERGLDAKGNKSDLIARLTADDENPAEVDVWELDVPELRKLAAERNVDLGEATSQVELATILEQAAE